MFEYHDGRIVAISGDITKLKVDAIVNAANSTLLGGGGVDGAIHRAGGSAVTRACEELRKSRYREGLPVGEAVETAAGNLPPSYVIHTVGPVWHGGDHDERTLLTNAYVSSLEIANRIGAETIAFPAISTGVYSYPRREAALVMFSAVDGFLATQELPKRVHLVFFSVEDLELFVETVPPKSRDT